MICGCKVAVVQHSSVYRRSGTPWNQATLQHSTPPVVGGILGCCKAVAARDPFEYQRGWVPLQGMLGSSKGPLEEPDGAVKPLGFAVLQMMHLAQLLWWSEETWWPLEEPECVSRNTIRPESSTRVGGMRHIPKPSARGICPSPRSAKTVFNTAALLEEGICVVPFQVGGGPGSQSGPCTFHQGFLQRTFRSQPQKVYPLEEKETTVLEESNLHVEDSSKSMFCNNTWQSLKTRKCLTPVLIIDFTLNACMKHSKRYGPCPRIVNLHGLAHWKKEKSPEINKGTFSFQNREEIKWSWKTRRGEGVMYLQDRGGGKMESIWFQKKGAIPGKRKVYYSDNEGQEITLRSKGGRRLCWDRDKNKLSYWGLKVWSCWRVTIRTLRESCITKHFRQTDIKW